MFKKIIITLAMLSFLGVSPIVSAGGQTSMADVKEETLDAATTLKSYAVDKKNQAVNEVDRLVAELDTRIDRLKARAEKAKGSAKTQMQETVTMLERKRESLQARVDALSASTADAWSHTKQGFIDAFDELQSAYEKAKTEFQS